MHLGPTRKFPLSHLRANAGMTLVEVVTGGASLALTGNIYSPPNRVWNFDSKFAGHSPPGSLDAVTIGRGALARF